MSIDLVFTLSKVINNKHMIMLLFNCICAKCCANVIVQCVSVVTRMLHVKFACVLHDERRIVEYAFAAYVELLRRICSRKHIYE